MISAIAPVAPLNLQDAENMAQRLHRLLSTLLPTSQAGSIIYYQPEPRTPGLLHMLDQFQEINRQSKDEGIIALSEFSIGLYYLSWQQFTDADGYFRKAMLFWSLINFEAATSLTHFALGCNQFLALNYVVAMKHMQRARRTLDKLRHQAARGQDIDPPTPRAFLDAFHDALNDIQAQLQSAMQAMWTGPATGGGPAAGAGPTTGADTNTGPVARPPGSYATGAHIESDFPGEPVIDPELQPRQRFVAPFPSHIPAGEYYQWVQVTESNGNFIPHVRVGDWLYIHTAPTRRQFNRNDLLIIGSQINGSVRVEARGQRINPHVSSSPLYVARFVRSTSTGRILLLPNERRQLVELDPVAVLGNVIGFWREMHLHDL